MPADRHSIASQWGNTAHCSTVRSLPREGRSACAWRRRRCGYRACAGRSRSLSTASSDLPRCSRAARRGREVARPPRGEPLRLFSVEGSTHRSEEATHGSCCVVVVDWHSYPDHPDRVAVGRAALGPPRRAESSTRPRYRSRGFCHSPFPPVGRRCEEKRRSARHPWRKREVPQRSSDGGGRWILTPNKGCATCASCRSRSGRTSRSFSWRRQSCRAKTLEFLGWRGPKRAVELIKDRGKNRIANAART
jgi:hypothetical protein